VDRAVPTPVPDVAHAVLRATSIYDVPAVGRLPDGSRLLLLPRTSRSVPPLAVDRSVAILLGMLREPGPLPGFAHAAFGERVRVVIAELVLDGLLEVEHAGAFVSGIDAVEACAAHTAQELAPRSTTARLSLAALWYAEALDEGDAALLAQRLYAYHQYPLSPSRAREAASPGAAAARLSDAATPAGALLHRHWLRAAPGVHEDGWSYWVRRSDARDARDARQREDQPTYKLYVSPDSSAIAATLPAMVSALAAVGAPPFKVACGVYGALRPDKIVVYARDQSDLHHIATALEGALAGLPAHGVPFTAELARGGLLSWGMDPPACCHGAPSGAGVSWRQWVTAELARYLAVARLSPRPPIERWRFAAQRLGALGVDVSTWAPSAALWPAGRARSARA
jgi:hypothetical protein